jgi:serine/threonine-protein kinase HipA
VFLCLSHGLAAHGEGVDYLGLAQFIRSQGDAEYADADLAQLFRRVAFNVAIGNCDDHLRNHGFVLDRPGLRLAPVFDVNPNMEKGIYLEHQRRRHPSRLGYGSGDGGFYGLTDTWVMEMAQDVVAVASGSHDVARRAGLAAANIDLMGSAFSALARWRARSVRSKSKAAH